MTMAPEPGTRIVWMSVLLEISRSFIDHSKKFAENIVSVMWAGRSFRVELHAQDGFVFKTEPFKRVVVQALVGDFNLGRLEVASGDAIIMVLGSNENFP